ncbi:2-hydroxyacid dehydrogenase [Segeticoccus rhizosphaerae]|uniref:2-hydroxyacid dehydrogenase n=1 Tax=Segeticoccus rhizosphaerae TaxID=1104777 RepID=UPI0010C119D6|nr:NAD(P)-dependent oxidoreductase [Ornithinicoccus soli]
MNATSRPTPQVLVLGAVADSQLERLRRSCAVDQVAHADVLRPVGRRLLERADGLLVTGQYPVDVRLLEAAPRVRVVSLRAVGHDSVDLLECARRGVQVCNTPGVLDAAVAELTVLLILALARRLPEHLISTADAVRPQVTLGRDMVGRTLGIVGMGRIGKRVAQIAAQGLGMHVLHTTRREPAEEGSGWVSMDELLARADVISLHLPLTDATRHFVGARELKLMKQGAILVNASRAGLVDTEALADSLNQAHLYGAALDVTAQEWIPVDHPLRRAPNVVLTPHLGSATEETRTAMAEMAVSNLLLALRGDPPLSVVSA